MKFKEASTPTSHMSTCASLKGDDDTDSLLSFHEAPEARSWAELSEFASETLNVEAVADVEEKPLYKRRSGRARQREKRRQRLRTPSP